MKYIDWMKVTTWIVLPLLAAFFYGAIVLSVFRGCWDGNNPLPAVRSDTVFVRDTIRDTVPKVVYSEVVRHDTVPIVGSGDAAAQPTEGFLAMTDSGVVVPISRKVYTDDSTYRAVVSGYRACLDEIETYRERQVITKTITKTKKWNVGVTGGLGYGLTTGRPDVFVGFGVVYNIPP